MTIIEMISGLNDLKHDAESHREGDGTIDDVFQNDINVLDAAIEVLTSLQTAERRTENETSVQSASWELRYVEDYDDEIHCCSFCGEPDAISRDDYSYRGGKIRDNDSNYRPQCGAKMDGGEENETHG